MDLADARSKCIFPWGDTRSHPKVVPFKKMRNAGGAGVIIVEDSSNFADGGIG